MRISRRTLCLHAALLIGCASSTRSSTVTEYRPRTGPVEHPAPYSDVYTLWHWIPAPGKNKTQSTSSKVVRQVPVEVTQAYAARGSPLGFRRQDGQLIAIAGATTQPIASGHYTWQTLAGETSHMDEAPVDDDQPEHLSPFAQLIFDQAGDLLADMLEQKIDGSEANSAGGKSHLSHASANNAPPASHRPKPTSGPSR